MAAAERLGGYSAAYVAALLTAAAEPAHPLPRVPLQRILDIVAVPDLRRGDVIGAVRPEFVGRGAEPPHERHPHLLHHPAGGEVLLVGRGEHAPHALFHGR